MASETRLEEIRARLEAATPGPWELYATEHNVIAITKGRLRNGYRREIVHWSGFDCSNIDDTRRVRANAALIAHAPSDLAYLLDEIARLTRELEEAREIIRDLVDDEDAGLVWLGRRVVCAYCTADGLYSFAHAADCPIIRARHAIAALRSEALGDGPVGAVCANCGAPNAAIVGGELDPDEAVCSVECYDQLMELGCPQEHGGTYRPKPARLSEGG